MPVDRSSGEAPEPAPPAPEPTEAREAEPPIIRAELASPPADPATSEAPADGSDEFIWPPPPSNDPWRHRRGEPRLFALFWLIWLGISASMSLAPLRMGGLADAEAARPACRQLMIMVVFGVVVLWPMVRLCQVPPRRPAAAVFHDSLVILVPALMLILPTSLVGWWPPLVVIGVGAMIATWTLLFGGILTLALSAEARALVRGDGAASRAGRLALWMSICILLVAAGPGVTLLAAPGELAVASESDANLWLMASPLTAVQEITRDRFWTGASARIVEGHWRAILFTGLLGGAAWLAGLLSRPRGGVGARDLHSPGSSAEADRPAKGAAVAEQGQQER